MALPTLLDLAQGVIAKALRDFAAAGEPLLAVDATAGNGHDTLFLARNIGSGGRVLAFDVQDAALAGAKGRLEDAGLAGRVEFILAGHESLAERLNADERIHAAMYNLGFLPGSDKSRRTAKSSTLKSLEALLPRLAQGAAASVHCYAGHQGGAEEALAVEGFLRGLPWKSWRVAAYGPHNKLRNPERLFLVERI